MALPKVPGSTTSTMKPMMELAGNLVNGVPIATPVFDGAREQDIVEHLEMGGCEISGQVTLYDGRTGDEPSIAR